MDSPADDMRFKPSQGASLGIELELQLVRAHDLDLSRDAADLLARLEKRKLPGAVKPEITESMIELNSGVHLRYAALRDELRAMRDAVVKEAGVLNLRVSGGGSHPFHGWADRRIYPTERFRSILERYGYLAKQFTVFGQHIHIGCPSADDAIYLTHMMTRYVPHFIALSASSPYVQRHDTLFNSARLNSVFAFPLSGRAPFMLRWSDFENDYFAQMERTGVVKSMKDFYWDIRPKPEYGTIELRVCDTPLTVDRAAALACYLQALCRYLLDGSESAPAESDYLVYNYNRFQACRFGLDGTIVHPKSYEALPLREDILTTLRKIDGQAANCGATAALEHVYDTVKTGSDATFLRREFEQSGSAEGMVNAAIRAFRQGGSRPPR